MRLRRAYAWKQRLRLVLYLSLFWYWMKQWPDPAIVFPEENSASTTTRLSSPTIILDNTAANEPSVAVHSNVKEGPSTTAASTIQLYESLPNWMKEYFLWHSQQLSLIHHSETTTDPKNWQQHRLLIVRCMDDDRCGGTSDRLKSVPLFLALAARSKRILFLRWNRPFALEEFLIPQHQYWNWSVPQSLSTILETHQNPSSTSSSSLYNQTTILSKKSQQLVSAVQNPTTWLVQGNLQFSGFDLYQRLVQDYFEDETDLMSLYHSFFHVSFAPSPAIAKIVQSTFPLLEPNSYVVAHIRAKYPGEVFRETGNLTALQAIVDNAICVAASLQTTTTTTTTTSTSTTTTPQPPPSRPTPVYLASDAIAVLQAAATKHPHVLSQLTTPSSSSQPLLDGDPPHLNFAQKDHPSAFYSIFVDLIIMSHSQCVTYGAGGFGRFGSLVSHNVTCRKAHSIKGVLQECNTSH
eukprot:scaffold9646_cov133-Cylindrotheca_fusiformis.AAC.8